MTIEPENELIVQSDKHRFAWFVSGKQSLVVYKQVDAQTLALTHTEVHPDLEGQGIGSKLVAAVLRYVDENHLSIVPRCPFVAAYITRHPEWQRVVSTTQPVSQF